MPGRHACRQFLDGVTNGAEWYAINGGMEDWAYLNSNCFQIVLEISCVKNPREGLLRRYWDNNKQSLLSYIEQVWNCNIKYKMLSRSTQTWLISTKCILISFENS